MERSFRVNEEKEEAEVEGRRSSRRRESIWKTST